MAMAMARCFLTMVLVLGIHVVTLGLSGRNRGESGRGHFRSCALRRNPNCCPGWISSASSHRCIQRRRSFSLQARGGPCGKVCLNGGICSHDECICRDGYQGEYCDRPLCSVPCENGGRCIGPDRCACVYGYTGRYCQTDYRTGPCYAVAGPGLCQAQLPGLICTKQLCCATVGRAWGHPCEACPTTLPCNRGFIIGLHTGQCEDVDECRAIPGVCDGGTCYNNAGSFSCDCPAGSVLTEDNMRCERVSGCSQSRTVCNHGTCIDTDGDYRCRCNVGYIASSDGKHCLDTQSGTCYLQYSSGHCVSPLTSQLSQVDCCCGGDLSRGWGHQDLLCLPCPLPNTASHERLCGRPPLPSTRGVCQSDPDVCGDGTCHPTIDGHRCTCHPGYELSTRTNRCQDVNECRRNDICGGGECTNTEGSYSCRCPAGLVLDTELNTCTDEDECSSGGVCANGRCVNLQGTYSCECLEGYSLAPSGKACIDVDECSENGLICLHGVCVNTLGSYTCRCSPGYTLSADSSFCVDLDECRGDSPVVGSVGIASLTSTGPCGHGRCVNTAGSYQCVCHAGFRLPSQHRADTCLDVNECQSEGVCEGGNCVNSAGSFTCNCPAGFTLAPDGTHCQDVRRDFCMSVLGEAECGETSAMPVTRSQCCCSLLVLEQPMAWGSRQCQHCPLPGSQAFDRLCRYGPGLSHDGNDIDECVQRADVCDNGVCENLVAGYRCVCSAGFQPDVSNKHCLDIDECALQPLLCRGGQCRNIAGGYQCICPAGTKLDETTNMCADINECVQLGEEACVHGRCINTPEGFECVCPEGMTLARNKRVCLDSRRDACWLSIESGTCERNSPTVVLQIECCCSLGVAWGSPCRVCDRSMCQCPPGKATLDGVSCSDINECVFGSGVCGGGGGTCLNTDGSFTCQCRPGLSLDSSGTKCVDLRRNTCFTQHRHGQCSAPLVGAVSRQLCCCSLGAAWGDDRCEQCPALGSEEYEQLCPRGIGFLEHVDINECLEFESICSNGRCSNTLGSFQCKCHQGFSLDVEGIHCADIDECAIMKGVCGNGTCHNTEGHFRCKCDAGFQSTSLIEVCMDIDECSQEKGLCRGGRCINTPGSFKCACPPGHEVAPDGKSCKDIDECSRTSGICSNGVCENMMGSYQCVCDLGYTQMALGTHCTDMDECIVNNGGCEHLCVNSAGSFTCSCRPGFRLEPDGRRCSDVNECGQQADVCAGGTCTNTVGSFRCSCQAGLQHAQQEEICQDVDECATMSTSICVNGRCENTHGSFICHCNAGFTAANNDTLCRDLDECTDESCQCDLVAECINTPGSYRCVCPEGFVGDGFQCNDINECLDDYGGCSQDAVCVNTEGSYKCTCDRGFSGDGIECVDLDECADDLTLCQHGHCLNTAGSYRCDCEMGFMHPTADHQTACVDIDECSMFNNLCVHGRCENTHGMFRCVCQPGYQLDSSGANCTDINECDDAQSCLYGTCVNSEGSYTCTCDQHHQLTDNGRGCVDLRTDKCFALVESVGVDSQCSMVTGRPASRSSCCCSVGRAWGSSCQLCPDPDTEQYRQLCPNGAGYRINVVTVVIEDIDECAEMENVCVNGRCINTYGSYMCTCDDGFKIDPTATTCTDVDECASGGQLCGVGRCHNIAGSFQCHCPAGHRLSENGRDCEDTRRLPCYLQLSETGQCSRPMRAAQTRLKCCCSMGVAWGVSCERCPAPYSDEHTALCGGRPGFLNLTADINECEMMPHVCGYGTCINTLGSFTCQCRPGYALNPATHSCTDVDECSEGVSGCSGVAQCINTAGSFLCRCPSGFLLSDTGLHCDDIDECSAHPPVCVNGRCNNIQGSFQCECGTGFTLSSSGHRCEDNDECSASPDVCANGMCFNTHGSFTCHCFPGFSLSSLVSCEDVDECKIRAGSICNNGRCRNTPGSFLCQCADGFRVSTSGDHCVDIDECFEQVDFCPAPGLCTNLLASARCSCPPGFRLSNNNTQCQDVDECATGKVCQGGSCLNTAGSFSCSCPAGHQLSADNLRCEDVRQLSCFDRWSVGGCTGQRDRVMTRWQCCCTGGYGWGEGGKCQVCPPVDTPNFQQLCPGGLGRGFDAGDLDECSLMSDLCENGVCVNTDGSYRCRCNAGYKQQTHTHTCIDENECVINPAVCGNGTCTNTDGSFTCQCAVGFSVGSDGTCVDIDECTSLGTRCAYRCHNTAGSFRCLCPYGYQLSADALHCQDVDECNTPANKCRFACKNLIGSFMCVCPRGYRKVGDHDDCQDIDECSSSEVCAHGRCVNTEGSYRCDCDEGFVSSSDSTECIDVRVGPCFRHLVGDRCVSVPPIAIGAVAAPPHVSRSACCCGAGVAWGENCQRCPAPGMPQYRNLCLQGGFSSNGSDIDECSTLTGLCVNGRCINTLGSYRCGCNRGYAVTAGGINCVDVDECIQGSAGCQHSCRNTPGSYQCSCNPGFTLAADTRSCHDIDECREGLCGSHTCLNTHGSYRCVCSAGFRPDHHGHCLDIDECGESRTICGVSGAVCHNTVGSYTCACPRGYSWHEEGGTCWRSPAADDLFQYRCGEEEEDDGYCDEQERPQCTRVLGRLRCSCSDGYRYSSSRRRCEDVDECQQRVCGSASCSNLQGSYQCLCPSGYQLHVKLLVCVQMTAQCANSGCKFGCGSGAGSSFSCQCPPGYQNFGQGHCVSAINSNVISSIYTQTQSKVNDLISTEGCYSCQRNQRSQKRRRRSVVKSPLTTSSGKHRVHVNVTEDTSAVITEQLGLRIHVHANQTGRMHRILQLQPATKQLQGALSYKISDGNKDSRMILVNHAEGGSLYFTRAEVNPASFHVNISTHPNSDQFTLPLHVLVTP